MELGLHYFHDEQNYITLHAIVLDDEKYSAVENLST